MTSPVDDALEATFVATDFQTWADQENERSFGTVYHWEFEPGTNSSTVTPVINTWTTTTVGDPVVQLVNFPTVEEVVEDALDCPVLVARRRARDRAARQEEEELQVLRNRLVNIAERRRRR